MEPDASRGQALRTFKSVFGIAWALGPVLYFGGLAVFFLDTSGSVENAGALGLGPIVLQLGIVGFLFCIPLIIKIMRILPGPRPPISSSGGSPRDDDEGFDPDVAIARYMASKRTAEPVPSYPAALPAPKASAPAARPGFGRKIR